MFRRFRVRNIPCTWPNCTSLFKSISGRTQHINAVHVHAPHIVPPPIPLPSLSPSPGPLPPSPGSPSPLADMFVDEEEALPPNGLMIETHPLLTGDICDALGNPLPDGSPPPARPARAANDYTPYESRVHFEIVDFLFRKAKVSGGNTDELMQLWGAFSERAPFADHKELHESIDSISLADIPWQAFEVTYTGPRPEHDVPAWMEAVYTVWYRDPRDVLHAQLGNADFAGEMDHSPKRMYHGAERVYKDFMSGDWAWQQADTIAQDPTTHGATFCPIVLGSDKTTVSVATGQNEYYPLYLSNGLVHNTVRHAQRNAVSLVAFLAIPKSVYLVFYPV
ncbi:hypothetical protein BD311DRAFT_678191 [Dichomitus squalens]|uniref:C2H2-type domain-containing protein n=1 Tax=Dichomitus squalens TaxID=114155 RepID=A0A4Q9M4P5_9APHY|nr:hypothetical protein BD311DRAFT_678990 [Dichomitus squalens]TBU21507.1 hypothetical protein BD311DRAFT_678191 [Dichomitus squalens]